MAFDLCADYADEIIIIQKGYGIVDFLESSSRSGKLYDETIKKLRIVVLN